MKKVSWGVLSTAKIGLDRVLPPMKQGKLVSLDAIASRSLDKAREAAAALGIPKAYGSYKELLADPGIEAVYNPLPNHLHVDWTEKALAAGKHVLCEKPIGMNAAEAERLVAAQARSGKLVMEAFMVRFHPQWLRVRELIAAGRIGPVRAVQIQIGYNNPDPANIRNIPEVGGGGLMDIGCYAVLFARLAFGAEPRRAIALIDRDPAMRTDRLASAILDFGDGRQATLLTGTQIARGQRVTITGPAGWIAVEIPVNAPDDRPCRIVVDDGRDLLGSGREAIDLPVCNQYGLQGDAFSAAIRTGAAPEMSLAESIANMRVLDALFRSEKSAAWEEV